MKTMRNSVAQIPFLWILLCLLLLVQDGFGASFTETEGRVVMEAEHYDNLRPTPSNGVNWELTTDEPPATSNNEYMFSSANSHSSNYGNDFNQTVLDNSPRMDFECNFTTGGTYYIWILAKDKGGNSIFFGIDFQINTTNSNQGMEWDHGWLWADQYRPDGNNTAYMEIPAGVHTVNIYQREDGSAIDKIVLTTDPDYEPAGFGPNETVDSGPVNNPPVVDAGSPQTILWPLSVQLSGTVTDDDPNDLEILTVLWSKVSGPAGSVVFDDETAVDTLAAFPSPGTYQLQLQAWDELSQEGYDTVTITVDEPVCPPSDQNADCIVMIDDLHIVAGKWLDSDVAVNIIGDEKIDLFDYAMFASEWLDDWTGSLTVNLYPAQAVSEGAQWKVDGGSWKVSGFEQAGLLPGVHTVEFKQLDNWLKPSSQIVQVVEEQMTTVNGTYMEIPDATLQISELMASNYNTSPPDGQGEYDDWIEIYNYGTDPIDIGGMYLTDNLNKPMKWQIPDDVPAQTTIAGDGFLLIWADNEIDEGSLHAGFSLEADNGEIGLVKWDGVTLLDSIEYDRQVTDISCGRNSETDTLIRYYQVATPGSPNSSPYDGMVADTKFSYDRGFYDADIDVAITCATPGAIIRYSLNDEDVPTTTSGTIYTGPIAISKGSPSVYDRATTTLRAIAYKPGWLSTNVDTHTYIFLEDVIRQPADISGWPRPSMSLGYGGSKIHDYEMDPEIVDDPAYSPVMIKAMTDIPTLSIVANTNDINMSANSGFYWGSTEEPCSIELMYPHDPGKNVQADCGIESHSHNRMKRSMKLSFKTEYGNASFRSSLFQDAPLNGNSAAREVDRFVLRGGNNRCWARGWNPGRTTYTIDQWYRDTQVAMSGFGCRGTFVHLYINGLYWGLYNPTERLDSRFSSSYFGGEPEDWFAVYHGGDQSGIDDRFDYLKNTLTGKDMTVQANYEEMQEYLDIPHYIDYLLLNWYQGTRDWPGNNWWGGNQNNPAGPFRYYAWDGEWSWYSARHGQTNGLVYEPSGTTISFWSKLKANDDFMILFADRVYKHMFNNGALTEENSKNRFITLNNFIRDAVIAESARWGDVCEGLTGSYFDPYHATRTRDVDFVYWENTVLGSGFMTGNVTKLINSLRGKNYYPSIGPPAFLINAVEQHGGYVSLGSNLTMTSAYEVYYTLDGQDPRLPGGAVNPAAVLYGGGTIPITETTLVKARARNGTEWSALHEAPYTLLNVSQSLRVTEIMYHPSEPSPEEITAVGDPTITDENFEFIELKNIGVAPINLNLVNFTNGFEYTFADSVLASGEYVIVVKDPVAVAARYDTTGMNIASGQYIGLLDNEGEKMELTDAVGAVIQAFRYNDVWYEITDGLGFSLTIKDPTSADPNDWDTKGGWRPSASVGGSPGGDDAGDVPELGSIKINELLAHSDLAPNDWIELYNTTDQPINIGGWFLSDDSDDLMKYEIAARTTIGAYSYLVFTQDYHFGNAGDSGSHTQFALSENGESLFLHSGQAGQVTGYSEEETFGASEVHVAFGRHEKSTGTYNFVSMSAPTPGSLTNPNPYYVGALNAYPKVGPMVVSEIMYHPDPEGDAEYIELINISGGPVTLYDYTTSEPWKITSGFTYTFPAGTPVTLANNERFLLIKDLGVFTGKYGAPVGQYDVWTSGSLNNGGERIEISMPGDVNAQSERQYIRIDRVTYDDEFPWPTEPDGPLGNGSSLQRKVNLDYGNDVANWEAAVPSPGI